MKKITKKTTKKYQSGGKAAPVKKSMAAIADENDRAGADSYADYMNSKMAPEVPSKMNPSKMKTIMRDDRLRK